jgi:hypothetical protein
MSLGAGLAGIVFVFYLGMSKEKEGVGCAQVEW